MSDNKAVKDFAITPIGNTSPDGPPGAINALASVQGSPVSKKPCYLVTLDGAPGKGKTNRFIALDKPDWEQGFIKVRGIYTDEAEEKVITSFNEIVSETPKEQQVEIFFPWHRVHSIRSLVFNAVKLIIPMMTR